MPISILAFCSILTLERVAPSRVGLNTLENIFHLYQIGQC